MSGHEVNHLDGMMRSRLHEKLERAMKLKEQVTSNFYSFLKTLETETEQKQTTEWQKRNIANSDIGPFTDSVRDHSVFLETQGPGSNLASDDISDALTNSGETARHTMRRPRPTEEIKHNMDDYLAEVEKMTQLLLKRQSEMEATALENLVQMEDRLKSYFGLRNVEFENELIASLSKEIEVLKQQWKLPSGEADVTSGLEELTGAQFKEELSLTDEHQPKAFANEQIEKLRMANEPVSFHSHERPNSHEIEKLEMPSGQAAVLHPSFISSLRIEISNFLEALYLLRVRLFDAGQNSSLSTVNLNLESGNPFSDQHIPNPSRRFSSTSITPFWNRDKNEKWARVLESPEIEELCFLLSELRIGERTRFDDNDVI